MKASICTQYGPPSVLKIQEVETPSPKENEILIKVSASSVTAADGLMRTGTPYIGRLFLGFTKPKTAITGTGFSGEVVQVGSKVNTFNIGDEVCGESVFGAGTNTEYTVVAEDSVIIPKPSTVSHAQAACLCDGALTSLSMLKDIGELNSGQSVLINGASGSLGSAAVEIAKNMGAHVTGVCSAKNLEMVKNLGADDVIDYTSTTVSDSPKKYDLIYDSVGKLSFREARKSLSQNGKYVSPVLSFGLLLQVMKTSLYGNKKAKFSATGMRPAKQLLPLLQEIQAWLEAGKLNPYIDKTFSLHQIAEAHRYVDTGRKKGNIVVID